MKNSRDKLKLWEICLLLGLGFSTLMGAGLQQEQDNLAEGIIRLHIVANSDSASDQALKLKIRDAVLEQAKILYEEGMTAEEAEEIFRDNINLLQNTAQALTTRYSVTAQVTQLWFPTKYYDNFALPAGEYLALQITIGEAEGENWWCVAYPPLCLGAASETVDWAVEAGHFSPSEADLITGNGYILKFKSMELLQTMRGIFS